MKNSVEDQNKLWKIYQRLADAIVKGDRHSAKNVETIIDEMVNAGFCLKPWHMGLLLDKAERVNKSVVHVLLAQPWRCLDCSQMNGLRQHNGNASQDYVLNHQTGIPLRGVPELRKLW